MYSGNCPTNLWYHLPFMAEYSIGLDLGGTNSRAGAIDKSGKLLEKVSGATPFESGREPVLTDMVAVIEDLRSRWGTAELGGIGVVVPGFIRLKEGVIGNSNNLAFLENFPIRDELEKRLKAPVILENDAN